MALQAIQRFSSTNNIPSFPNAAGVGVVGGQPFMRSASGLFPLGDVSPAKTYWVDANAGSDSNGGLAPDAAFSTMAKAFAMVASGDTIYFSGKIKEQLTTPVQVFNVTVIGVGTRPRHADSTPSGGEINASTWTAPDSPAATTPLVKVLQQGWRFENILFAGPADAACIVLFRDAGAGNAERDASHASIVGCRFASGQDGIHIVEVFNTLIEGNIFMGMTGYDIKGVAGAGVANPLMGTVRNNVFIGSANHFYVTCSKWLIEGNKFDDGGTPNTTVVCDVVGSGVGAANNFVINNYFQTATANFNAPDVVGTATDVWNNISIDGTFTSGGVNGGEYGQPA